MPALIDIRRRIRSVKSTEQITKAMKMVSASKLRRARERVGRLDHFVAQAERDELFIRARAHAARAGAKPRARRAA